MSDDFDILPDGIYHEYMDDEEFTECRRSVLLIKNMGDLTMWELDVLETQLFLCRIQISYFHYPIKTCDFRCVHERGSFDLPEFIIMDDAG